MKTRLENVLFKLPSRWHSTFGLWGREGGRKSGRAGQREGEISFPEFCFPAWLISLSGLILRADSWEEFSPRRCQTSLRWDYFSGGGGFHCFPRAHEATRWVCVLMTCLADGNAGLHSAGSEDDAMQVVFDLYTVLHMALEEGSRAGWALASSVATVVPLKILDVFISHCLFDKKNTATIRIFTKVIEKNEFRRQLKNFHHLWPQKAPT